MYTYVSPVAGCGTWDSNPERLSYKYGASLPNNKILKANADDKILVNVIEKLKADFRRENIVGKRENVAYQHFLLFLQCFQMASFSGS